MTQLSSEELPTDFVGLLHAMPRREDFGTASASYLIWLALATAAVQRLGPVQSVAFAKLANKARSQDPYQYWEAYNDIATFIRAAARTTAIPEQRAQARLSGVPGGWHSKVQTRGPVASPLPTPKVAHSSRSDQSMLLVATENTAATSKTVGAAAVRIAAAAILVAVAWLLAFTGREHSREAQPAAGLEANIASGAVSAAPRQAAALQPSETGSLSRPADPVLETDRKQDRPAARQQVAFARPAITVSARAAAAVLTVRRSNGRSGRAQVMWRIKEGTARAGREFGGPLQGRIEFADLQTVRSLYVPLKGIPTTGGARNFVVELTATSDDVLVAPNHAVTVTIINYE